MGAYFNVLRVLGLRDNFLKLAADDDFGRKLQDLQLISKVRYGGAQTMGYCLINLTL